MQLASSYLIANVTPYTVIILRTASSCNSKTAVLVDQKWPGMSPRVWDTETHTHTRTNSLAAPAVKVSVFSRQNRGLSKAWENEEECILNVHHYAVLGKKQVSLFTGKFALSSS